MCDQKSDSSESGGNGAAGGLRVRIRARGGAIKGDLGGVEEPDKISKI